jgi:hypothetical protein
MRLPVPGLSLARHLLISHWRTATSDPIRKASEAMEAPDGQRQTIDLRDCSTAIAAGLAASMQRTHQWSRWDWIRWGAFWFLVAGPVLFLALIFLVP